MAIEKAEEFIRKNKEEAADIVVNAHDILILSPPRMKML
jgi:ABC-type nitrate/sulfonate/bicarbonate transport system substrate-binding protein